MGAFATVAALIGVISIVLLGGVVWGVSKAAGWGGPSKKQLKAASAPKPYAYLDASDSLDDKDVTKVVANYTDDKVLGPYARAIESDFATFDARKGAIMQILDAEFEPHSMTWDRFCVPLDTARGAIIANAAQMANHMQTFDSAAYDHLSRMEGAGALADKPTDLDRLDIARNTLRELDALRDSNARLLVEVEHLQAELSQLSGQGLSDETDEIASEIARLAEEARYYA